MATLANRIKTLRTERGLTQAEFGKRLGVVKSTVSLYENGRSVPNDQIKTAMCRFFDVSMDYLMGMTDKRDPRPEASRNQEPPDPAFLEAMECLEGLSGDALDTALRCLQAIKTLDDTKVDSDNVKLFEKNA